ncbi:hypothetical protein HPB47_028097 [Ixodes persulcatus]|uniref:Uncharacterized protein n=1 Tax=Ixodes persulcatus TaxID=34615 RepID=A0AC60PUG2_IXOPE|nr:hypothetical protein HPB47_028097 [Ixodes persulcatus]
MTSPGQLSGKRAYVKAAPASVYETALQVAATAGGKEPLLELTIGDRVFHALLDTGSSVSLFGDPAVAAARATGAGLREEAHSLRLAMGWSSTTQSIRRRIRWSGGLRKLCFIHMPGLCRDVILG